MNVKICFISVVEFSVALFFKHFQPASYISNYRCAIAFYIKMSILNIRDLARLSSSKFEQVTTIYGYYLAVEVLICSRKQNRVRHVPIIARSTGW